MKPILMVCAEAAPAANAIPSAAPSAALLALPSLEEIYCQARLSTVFSKVAPACTNPQPSVHW